MNISSNYNYYNQTKSIQGNHKHKSTLNSLVDAGTITVEQEKAIKDRLEEARASYKAAQSSATNLSNTSTNPLDSLVDSGTITKDQESTIKSVFEAAKNNHRMQRPKSYDEDNSNSITNILSSLTTDGTITQDQNDTMISVFESAMNAYEGQAYSYDDTFLNSFNIGM